jgi:hypothetical protein
MKKIISIQYPSGGFGHTIHAILSMFGNNFSGEIVNYKFGIGGDSHRYPQLLPKMHNVADYKIELFQQALEKIDDNKNTTVLIDSGITDDTLDFKKLIVPDVAIRICYDDWSWALLAKLFYTRCMSAVDHKNYTVFDFVKPDDSNWSVDYSKDWAKREKFFLYLRDHHFRHAWRPANTCVTLPVDKILNYRVLHNTLNQWFNVVEFEDFYTDWYVNNEKHFNFYFDCLDIINCVESKQSMDLTGVDELFDQAVVYYYIWLKYNFEVPHNDCSNWFTTTDDIVKMLTKHGVAV